MTKIESKGKIIGERMDAQTAGKSSKKTDKIPKSLKRFVHKPVADK